MSFAQDFTQLLRQDFSDLEAAATSWKKLAEELTAAQRASGRRVSGPLHKAGWEGVSAHYGFAALEATESKLGTAHINVQLIATALGEVGDRMQSAKRKLRAAVQDAESAGHNVTPDGLVERISAEDAAGGATPHRFTVEDANSGQAGYQQRINEAVEKAQTASWKAAKLLEQIDPFDLDKRYGNAHAQEDAERLAKWMGLGEGKIPDGDNPKANAEWWDGLDDSEQRTYLAAYPEKIGWLDGLPAEVRDQANRTVLDEKVNNYALGADNGSLGVRDGFMYDSLSNLKERLDKADAAPPGERLYLLGVDPEAKDGRAIVAMGNPDKADHTAVLVPGTDTDMSSMPGQITRVEKMHEAASDSANGESVSVISWLGYDAPEVDGSVATPGRAEEGAPNLRSFAEGTRVAREDGGHLTVVGHSYGTTVVGTADSSGRGLGADDVIALGSPGMNVEKATDLRTDPQHVWVGATQQDPIVRHASGLTLGGNPALEGFGAQSLAVNDGGHSSYWDSGKMSLKNQGSIIAGRIPQTGPYYHGDAPINPVGPNGENLLVIG